MKNQLFIKKAFRFRRFTRKAYAAFASIHREVTIGTVSSLIADREMLKAGRSVALVCLLLTAAATYAEDASPDETLQVETEMASAPLSAADRAAAAHRQLSLQEVQVVAHKAEVNSEAFRLVTCISHAEIEALPIQTVADILKYLPGLDVRTRGANGAQADVSMRGGTFDQVLVMINGVNLTDAHTGHYSLNLPISASLIERVEVLQGTSAHLFGLNAFSGAINIVTRSTEETAPSGDYTLHLSAGQYGLVNPSLSGRWKKGDFHASASAEYNRADGYGAPDPSEKEATAIGNSDYKIANLYVETGYKGLDIQLGAQYKDAGAGMYYGFGSQDQFDATRTAFGSAHYAHQWNNRWGLDATLAYRANYDRYEWHRGQRLYGNFHFSQTTAANVKAYMNSRIGRTTVGLELRNENIHSTNLGDTVNAEGQVPNVNGFELSDLRVLDLVKGANRLSVNYFAEQSFFWRQLSASIGVSGNWNNQFGNNIAGGANIGYEYAPASSVYLNANRSLRLPTFTDLYYNAGNQLGNRDLKPEEAWTLALGTKYQKRFAEQGTLHLQADAYYRWGRNIIDWVFTPDDQKRPYHAQNWNEVNAAGVDLTLGYRWNQWIRSAEISYAFTHLDLDVDKSGSRYLDYLSQKFVAHLEHGIWCFKRAGLPGMENSAIGASWTLTFQKREGQYNNAEGEVCDYSPVLLLDGQLFWECKALKVALDCTNLTNRHYYDYGGLLQPGAWAKLSITAKLH